MPYLGKEPARVPIDATDIPDDSITAAKIVDGTIVAADIETGAVDTAELAADAVTGAKIEDNAIDSEHYTDGSIDNAHIADNAIDSEHYADGSIDNAHIADNAIDSEHYADGSIDNAHIADDAIDSEHYADGSIDTAHIGDLQVTTAKIAADAITAAKIADDVINSEHYAAGSIDNEHIADDAINSEHYADGSIDNAHIADDAIDSEHYAADSIDTEHYAAGSVDATALGADCVTAAKIGDNVLNSEHYAAASIDNEHLADDAVGVAELSATGTASSSTFLRGDNAWATAGTTYAGIDDQSSSNDDQLTIKDAEVVINEDSDDLDFRVESNLDTHALFVNGADSGVVIKGQSSVRTSPAAGGGILDIRDNAGEGGAGAVGNHGGGVVFGVDDGSTDGYFCGIKGGLGNGGGNTAGHLKFYTRGETDDANLTERMRIEYQGHVGIGNTPKARHTNFVALDIGSGAAGTVSIEGRIGDYSTYINRNSYFDVTNVRDEYRGTGYAQGIVMGDTGVHFRTAASGSADASITWGTRASVLHGGGISFNGDTAQANALDDYEEGTWTPSLNSASGVPTQTAGECWYIKVGKVCHMGGSLSWSANGNYAGSTTRIDGMPFTPSNTNPPKGRAIGTLGACTGLTDSGTTCLLVDPNNTRMYIMDRSISSGAAYSHNNTFAASGNLYGFSISYPTA